MLNRKTSNIFIISLFMVYIVLYEFVLKKFLFAYVQSFSASFIIIITYISIMLLGYHKDKNNSLKRYVFNNTMLYVIITFIFTYFLGFFTGFLKNGYSLNPITMFNNIFAPVIIAVLIELFRYVMINKNSDSKRVIGIITLVITLFELVVNTKFSTLTGFDPIFRYVTSVFVPIIFKNLLLSYLCYHVGYRTTIVYRLILDIYSFVLPFFPDLGEYITSMIFIALPILIFVSDSKIIESYDEYSVPEEKDREYGNGSKFEIPLIAFIILLIALISRAFPIYMMGIGSNSMKPVISKGDAVIVRKVDNINDLKKGQIIVFKQDGKYIVHRLIKLDKSKELSIVTKGDANNSKDVKNKSIDDVEGIVEFKIPLIGYPSVLLDELLKGRR